MRRIVYYVATSLDGFISGIGNDITAFVPGGSGINQYMNDLKAFDTVIMGRRTYEFGYKFGLQPGQPAYPQMEHYIFSNSLKLPNPAKTVHVVPLDVGFINKLKEQPGTDIYLCGGGEFAGWLLDHQLIDVLKLKLNPIILGQGTRLFGSSTTAFQASIVKSQLFEDGLHIIEYQILR